MIEMKKVKGDKDGNANFSTVISEPYTEEHPMPHGTYNTVCLTCSYTCHYDCIFADNGDKARCCAMRDGKCTVCVEKCHWKIHKNLPHYYVKKTKKVTRSNS